VTRYKLGHGPAIVLGQASFPKQSDEVAAAVIDHPNDPS
jgi:L-fucose mutarotase/ribose pyranase (RbsD/FucU family)